MGKVLGSWSGIRKYLEQDIIAECLRGRIRYDCTTYVGMDDCKVFEVCIDGKQVKRFSWETVNTYFINNGYKGNEKPFGKIEYWSGFHKLLDSVPLESRTEYTDSEFCEALKTYRNQQIQSSIKSDNPIIRMFAVSDRRIGKRTLSDLKKFIDSQPEWLKQFYRLRIEAESL